MNIVTDWLSYGLESLVGILLFSTLSCMLLVISSSLLGLVFIILFSTLFIILLTMLPFILIPISIFLFPLALGIGLYSIWRQYPDSIQWLREQAFEKPKTLLKQQYMETIASFPLPATRAYPTQLVLRLITVAAILLSLLTYQVVSGGMLAQWNMALAKAVYAWRSPALDQFFVKISLFNSLAMAGFWSVISVYFLVKKDRWRAIHWIGLGLFVATLTVGLKYSTAIPRPGAAFHIHDSFPSAHVSGNMTLLGGLLILLDLSSSVVLWKKRLIYGIYALWVYLIGLSRLYLAAHWGTDLIGGALVSIISLSLLHCSYHRRVVAPLFRKELTTISVLTLGVLWCLRFVVEYEKILKFYLGSF